MRREAAGEGSVRREVRGEGWGEVCAEEAARLGREDSRELARQCGLLARRCEDVEAQPRQRGGGSAGERGDVCSWPHRSASDHSAPQGDEEAATADALESEASDLFASLGGGAARQARKSKGKPGRGRGRGAAEHGRAERPPLTTQQLTDILLG